MFAEERQDKIYELILKNKSITVEELSNIFEVSFVTIRKDLRQLENKGLIIRTHGGAMVEDVISSEIPYMDRYTKNSNIKLNISKIASEYIRNGTTIFIDAGTTTVNLYKYIKRFQDLVVVTNDLTTGKLIYDDLNPKSNNKIIFIGGQISLSSGSCYNSDAINTIKNYRFDICFMGCDAIDLNTKSIYTTSSDKGIFKNKAVEVSDKRVLLSDSSKVGKKGIYKAADLKEFDLIITDKSNKNFIDILTDLHIDYTLADR